MTAKVIIRQAKSKCKGGCKKRICHFFSCALGGVQLATFRRIGYNENALGEQANFFVSEWDVI
jgi:hypothetical protein